MSQSLGCMQLNEKNHVPFLTFPRLDELPYITHAFSTRKGGVSQQEFSSMNLNFNRGDSDANVLKNSAMLWDLIFINWSLPRKTIIRWCAVLLPKRRESAFGVLKTCRA